MTETTGYVVAGLSVLSLAIVILEKIFGGGNALANKFHELERATVAHITAVRSEMLGRLDAFEGQHSVGFEMLRTSIHEAQTELLRFKVKMAEDAHLYIRSDDYKEGIAEVKRGVHDGFAGVSERLGHLQDLVLHMLPEGDKPKPAK